jgi:hypothetical protein
MSDDDRLAAALTRFLKANLGGAPAVDVMAPGFVYEQHFGNTAESYEGDVGMRRWIDAFYEIWDEAQLEIRGVRGARGYRFADIAVLVHGPQSGIAVELRAYAIAAFDAEGRLLRVDTFNDAAEAEGRFAAVAAE